MTTTPLYSKVKIAGHPIHPMLIAFPVALYVATLVTLIVYAAAGDPFWFRAAVVCNAAGVIMAVVAAIPGTIDAFAGVPAGTRARGTAYKHALLNVTALILFLINLAVIWNQWNTPVPDAGSGIFLSILGVLATAAAGAYGWALVQTHHVGVQPLSAEDLAEAGRIEGERPPIPTQTPTHQPH
jgi:uncharacterized membrane protein